jgi:hypothetical protein
VEVATNEMSRLWQRSQDPYLLLRQMCRLCAREMLAEARSTGPQRLVHPLFLPSKPHHAILNLIVPVAQLDRAAAF